MTTYTDVLIVGAGPTGLTLASELSRWGISCRIIDKAQHPSTTSKALGIHSRTLELFEQRGLLSTFLQNGLKAKDAYLHLSPTQATHIMFKLLNEPYPWIFILPQQDTEAILLRNLQEQGVKVEWSAELTQLYSTAKTVTATIQRAQGITETIKARWLIGCDGTRSTVARLAKFTFKSSAIEELFFLADVTIAGQAHKNTIHAWVNKEGVVATFPLPAPNKWRVIINLPATKANNTIEPDLAILQQVLHQRTTWPLRLSDPVWMSRFKIKERLANTYQVNQVFLAGDAAHSHSPAGAQGMNIGIQDAYNLGWKLALVQKGIAQIPLLRSYQQERRPIAAEVVSTTSKSTKLMVSRTPLAKPLRNTLIKAVLGIKWLQKKVLYKASGLRHTYRNSFLSVNKFEKTTIKEKCSRLFTYIPVAGDRAPQVTLLKQDGKNTSLFEEFNHPGFTLLIFEACPACTSTKNINQLTLEAKAVFRNLVKVICIQLTLLPDTTFPGTLQLKDTKQQAHKVYRASTPCFCLVRPDGYIGYRSHEFIPGLLTQYASRLFIV